MLINTYIFFDIISQKLKNILIKKIEKELNKYFIYLYLNTHLLTS